MPLKLVSGKGGVGKTRVTAILAQEDKNSQVFEFSEDLETELQKLNFESREIIRPNYSLLIYDAIKPFLKIDALARWASDNKWVSNIFNLAPNMMEFLQLHQWVRLAKDSNCIVDASSTGNFLGLLKSVGSAQKMFDSGHLRKMAEEIDTYFSSPSNVQVYLVSLPENSALEEARELETNLKSIFPKLEPLKVINRKHRRAPAEIQIPNALHFLAYDRPDREDKRLEAYDFDFMVLEGGASFV